MRKHVLVGAVAASLLFLAYMGIIVLAQDLAHALDQTARLWYWVAALVGGFGIQAGLYSFIRHEMRRRRGAATASVAASGGVSAGSMAACCAHHLADVLPLLGLSGLAAFLVSYQTFFIIAGVLSNIVGIAVMLEVIQRHGLSRRLAAWDWNMRLAKMATIASAGLVLLVTFFLYLTTPLGG
jgi:hypothetical protein